MEIILIILLPYLIHEHVNAYLDPGTGSYFFQLAIGGTLGGLFFLKTFWKDIKAKIQKIFGKKDSV